MSPCFIIVLVKIPHPVVMFVSSVDSSSYEVGSCYECITRTKHPDAHSEVFRKSLTSTLIRTKLNSLCTKRINKAYSTLWRPEHHGSHLDVRW